MVTAVGLQSDFANALQELVELDYDAVEAYNKAIDRIENEEHKAKLIEFKEDHQRHIEEISNVLRKHGKEVPKGPSTVKQWLTKGKVILGNITGDSGILSAMRSNEIDTNYAYDRMIDRDDIWEDEIKEILKKGQEDEKRHKAWLDSVLSS